MEELRWPAPTVDCCATADNKTCERYISHQWDGAAIATDFLSKEAVTELDFDSEVLWINPPFNDRFIQRCLDLIVKKRAKAWLILPKWDAFSFFSRATDLCSAMIDIPPSVDLFKPQSVYPLATRKPVWHTRVCLFNVELGSITNHWIFEWENRKISPFLEK